MVLIRATITRQTERLYRFRTTQLLLCTTGDAVGVHDWYESGFDEWMTEQNNLKMSLTVPTT
jgi:hypothetical protein